MRRQGERPPRSPGGGSGGADDEDSGGGPAALFPSHSLLAKASPTLPPLGVNFLLSVWGHAGEGAWSASHSVNTGNNRVRDLLSGSDLGQAVGFLAEKQSQ